MYVKATSLPQRAAYSEMECARLTPAELARYHTYRSGYDQSPKVYRVERFPPCVQIEPTSICNYRCTFCYQTDGHWSNAASGHMGLMRLDLFQQAIDEAHGQCEAVTLASRGEPLIHPQFAEMLAYTTGKFVALKVNTNGWFLTEKLCHAFLDADLLTLVISADAASEPAYSQLRVGGTLARIVENLTRLHRIRAREYPDSRLLIRISGVKVPGTPDLDEMQDVWGALADQVCFVDYNPWENTYQRPVNDLTTPCSDLWRRMFLWWDGTVNPCDVDYKSLLRVGQFPASSLSDLWHGQPYTTLRQEHLDSQRSRCYPCHRCTVV